MPPLVLLQAQERRKKIEMQIMSIQTAVLNGSYAPPLHLRCFLTFTLRLKLNGMQHRLTLALLQKLHPEKDYQNYSQICF